MEVCSKDSHLDSFTLYQVYQSLYDLPILGMRTDQIRSDLLRLEREKSDCEMNFDKFSTKFKHLREGLTDVNNTFIFMKYQKLVKVIELAVVDYL